MCVLNSHFWQMWVLDSLTLNIVMVSWCYMNLTIYKSTLHSWPVSSQTSKVWWLTYWVRYKALTYSEEQQQCLGVYEIHTPFIHQYIKKNNNINLKVVNAGIRIYYLEGLVKNVIVGSYKPWWFSCSYQMMLSCWDESANQRPNFSYIVSLLESQSV